MQGARPGGEWTNLHHTHLPPDETPQSILYYSIHRDEGVQEAGGGGREIKRCMGSERNWGIYATMLSISQQQKGCVAVM